MCLCYLNVVYYLVHTLFLLQFLNEWPSVVTPLLRFPPVADMSPGKDRLLIHTLMMFEIYLPNDKLLRGMALHRLSGFVIEN